MAVASPPHQDLTPMMPSVTMGGYAGMPPTPVGQNQDPTHVQLQLQLQQQQHQLMQMLQNVQGQMEKLSAQAPSMDFPATSPDPGEPRGFLGESPPADTP